jgi:hypothetical protein
MAVIDIDNELFSDFSFPFPTIDNELFRFSTPANGFFVFGGHVFRQFSSLSSDWCFLKLPG